MNKIFSKIIEKTSLFFSRKHTMEEVKSSLSTLLTNGFHNSIKEDVRKYLTKHFSQVEHLKVEDFPTDTAWINTNEPLSIHRDLKGKIILLDFFTYCCINCMHVLPELKKLESKYSVEEGLVVIGVHCAKFDNEKETKNVLSAVQRYDITHAVVNDIGGRIWNSFDAHCWPTLALIGPSGELLLKLSGEGHFNLLDNLIENVIDIAKGRDLISNHLLPQIKVNNELKSFTQLLFPGKVAYSPTEHEKYIAISDTGHHRILITNNNGIILFTIGGLDSGFKDGNFNEVRFNAPQGLTFLNNMLLYVADTENHAIREINLESKTVKTVAGTGFQGNDRIGGKLWTEQIISSPWDVCFGKSNNILFIAMAGIHQIWALYLDNVEKGFFKKGKRGECKNVAGSGREENRNNFYPHTAAFAQPSGLTFCPDRNSLFIADSESSSIREINLENGKVSAVVGGNRDPQDLFAFGDVDGCSYDSKLQHALGVAWCNEDSMLYIADSYNHKLKTVDISNNFCSTIKLNVQLDEPGGLCCNKGNILIVDTNNHMIRKFNCKNSILSELNIRYPKLNTNIPISSEKEIEFCRTGGILKVNISLTMNDDFSLTEGAPSNWSISLTDEAYEQLSNQNFKEKFALDSELLVTIPNFLNLNIINILIEGNAYVCSSDTCTSKECLFVIRLIRSDSKSDNPVCQISHILA